MESNTSVNNKKHKPMPYPTVYKIRNKDGQYSSGGCYARFTKNGKVWNGLGALKNHLLLYIQEIYERDPYNAWRRTKIGVKSRIPEDWIIEEYELSLVKVREIPAKELMAKYENPEKS